MRSAILYLGTRNSDETLLRHLGEHTGQTVLRVRSIDDMRLGNTERFIDTVIVGTTVDPTPDLFDDIARFRTHGSVSIAVWLLRDDNDDLVDALIRHRIQPCYIDGYDAARAARIVAHMIQERIGVYRNVLERMCNELAHGRMTRKGGLVDKRK